MPYVCRNMFEKHLNAHKRDDDLHVQALSNPELAAQIAALKLVMNTNLREKLKLLDTEGKNRAEYLESIINQKNMQELLKQVVAAKNLSVGPHILALILQPLLRARYRG